MARPWRAAHIATSPSHLAPSRDLKSQQGETSNKMWHKDWVSPVLRDEDLLAVAHGLSSPTVLNWQLREQDRSHCCALWWQWSYKYVFGTKIGTIHQSYFWWPQSKVSFWSFFPLFLSRAAELSSRTGSRLRSCLSNQGHQINGKSGLSTLCESAVNNFEITAVSLPRSGLLFMPRGLESATALSVSKQNISFWWCT